MSARQEDGQHFDVRKDYAPYEFIFMWEYIFLTYTNNPTVQTFAQNQIEWARELPTNAIIGWENNQGLYRPIEKYTHSDPGRFSA